jgi:aspartate/tyrosine/aromatic aminotransferase
MSESRFAGLAQDPLIEVFELVRQFNEDTHPNKVNLGVGGEYYNSMPRINTIKL